MEQLFLEFVILMLAVIGILITVFEMCLYKTERKLYYKVIKLKNKEGKKLDIIVSAKDYDKELEDLIKEAFSTYQIET